MTEGKTSEDELTGDSDTSPAAGRKWYETPAGRAAASMVSVGFLGIVVAAMLLLTQRAHDAENATEATDSAPPTATATETQAETATETPTATATPPAPTTMPTTSAPAPQPPPPPAAPTFTPAPAAPAPAAPTTVPTTPAEPTTEEAEPEMPELNVTRGPIEMSPPRGDPAEEK
jgi:hypothetical protein